MEVHAHDHGSGPVANKISLSPFAVLALGLVMPIVGSMVRDRITTGGDAAVTATEVRGVEKDLNSVSDALKTHLGDAVHRNEFSDLQQQTKNAVTQEQFSIYSHSVDSRLESIKDDLKDIKDSLRAKK